MPTTTELNKIDFDGRSLVTVHLYAHRASLIKSLEATATAHFMTWQKWNYSKLGYKRCEVTRSEMGDILPNGRFNYALTFRLIYPKGA
jgi:hypothetical protein